MSDLGGVPIPNRSVRTALKEYLDSDFTVPDSEAPPQLPLNNEKHVSDWKEFIREAPGTRNSLFEYYQDVLEQLKFPIREGISESTAYKNVVRRGEKFEDQNINRTLSLERPKAFSCEIHKHPAGSLPVFRTDHRPDFLKLYRTLGHRSEPVPVSKSVNAQMVSGINNWTRVRQYKREWKRDNPPKKREHSWPQEMQKVTNHSPGTFRDRIMLITSAHYSGLAAEKLPDHYDSNTWRMISARLRLEHEFTHYATKRLYGAMDKNLWDELIADFMGMTDGALGFEPELFLRFLGIEDTQKPDSETRFHTYTKSLPEECLPYLAEITQRAADHLGTLHKQYYEPDRRWRFFLVLTRQDLPTLAGADWKQSFVSEWTHGE